MARGGFSSVYEVRSHADGQLYAIKKITLLVNTRNPSHIQKKLDTMLEEVKLLAGIKNPHVISYKDSWLETACSCPAHKSKDNEKEYDNDKNEDSVDDVAKVAYNHDVAFISPNIEFGPASTNREAKDADDSEDVEERSVEDSEGSERRPDSEEYSDKCICE